MNNNQQGKKRSHSASGNSILNEAADEKNEILQKYFKKRLLPDDKKEILECSEIVQTKQKKKKKKNSSVSSTTSTKQTSSSISSLSSSSSSSRKRHPFVVDPTDHAETPTEAYHDICPLLEIIAIASGKSKKDLLIYDPYYCDGGVKKHLSNMGFSNCYNNNEDFYECIKTNQLPEYDVLLTNPPYSGDHIPQLLKFCQNQPKPWIVLVPNYVYYKPYYLDTFMTSSINKNNQPHEQQLDTPTLSSSSSPSLSPPFFLVPKHRYTYFAPQWQPSKKLGGATSPFLSIFICDLKTLSSKKKVSRYLNSIASTSSLELARSAAEMPYRARTEADPMRSSKRPNPKQRKKLAMMKKKTQG